MGGSERSTSTWWPCGVMQLSSLLPACRWNLRLLVTLSLYVAGLCCFSGSQ